MGSDYTSLANLAHPDDFNPRSPHGERLFTHICFINIIEFQSTLPAWGATSLVCLSSNTSRFQSTLPAWGATPRFTLSTLASYISIHAPRMGSDHSLHSSFGITNNFNPRSPHGERRAGVGAREPVIHDFNPRSPHGERPLIVPTLAHKQYFNPRSPHGERRTLEGYRP